MGDTAKKIMEIFDILSSKDQKLILTLAYVIAIMEQYDEPNPHWPLKEETP